MKSVTPLSLVVAPAVVGLLLTGCSSSADLSPLQVTAAPSETPEAFTVGTSNFQVRYHLAGSVARSNYVGIDIPTGLVLRDASSASVRAGQSLGRLAFDPVTLNVLRGSAMSSSIAASRLAALTAWVGTVLAPAQGRLSDRGGVVGIVSTGSDVVTPLSPVQALRYSLTRFSGSATVETVFGSRTVRCVAVWMQGTTSGATVHCRLPDGIETALGLPATLLLVSQLPSPSMIVPNSFIQYDSASQSYFVNVAQSGSSDTRRASIVVGATDGASRVVVSGIKPGDTLMPPSS